MALRSSSSSSRQGPRKSGASRVLSPPSRSDRRQLTVKPDGTLRIAAIADTHSKPHPMLTERLAALRPDAILHAGDVGDVSLLDGLSSIAPVLAVRGNIDERSPELPDALTLELVAGDRAVLRLLLVHIGLRGVRLFPEVARLARAEGASLLVCGHSHLPFLGRDGDIHVFNPGSVGPRRFALPIVFGTLAWSSNGLQFAHTDCETGELWLPGRPLAPPLSGNPSSA